MKKRLFAFLLVCVICVADLVPAKAAGAQNLTIYINGTLFDTNAEIINSAAYVPVRQFSKAIAGAEVTWEDSTKTVCVTAPGIAMSVGIGAQYLTVNGRYFYLPDGCRNIGGSAMLPIRELAKAFGAVVEWDPEKRTVYVYKGNGVVESGDSFYSSDAVYWLSRVISSESGGESLGGQIAVGNVVLNRVKSGKYPNTIYEVIFQPYQFSPVITGAIYKTPSETSVIAAKICLEGYNVVGNSLYFCNPSKSDENRWFASSLTLMTVIGNHAFYA